MSDQRPTILITGASGGLASIVVDILTQDYRLIGVDPRPMPMGRNFPGEFHQIDYSHRKMSEIFRQNRFFALLHLGRVRADGHTTKSFRYRVNVLGTGNLLRLARKYGLQNLIVFSTFHVYGAHQANHVHIAEDAPLRASQLFPELVDAIELDHVATTFMWQYRDVRTVVLRPVNVIGRRINNTISEMLRANFCPTLLGYDPLQQFVHEQDIARALYLCLKGDKSGVYNITGEGAIPWSKAILQAGSIPIPVPSFLAYPLVGALSKLRLSFPEHLIDYFRYPTIVSDNAFRKDFGFEPSITTVDALRSLRPSGS